MDNFATEYAKRGYRLNADKIPDSLLDSADALGFLAASGLVAVRVYKAAKEGKPLSDVLPWIEEAEGGEV